jgi:hypothetical protein
MFKILFTLILLLLSNLCLSEEVSSQCKNLFTDTEQDFLGTKINVKMAESKKIDLKDGLTRFTKLVPDHGEHQVVIGMHGGHAFLITDDLRFDAVPLGAGFRKSNSLAPKGVVFSLKNVPAETVAEIKTMLQKKKFAYSCAHGVCKVLNESGIIVNEGKNFLLPSSLLKHAALKGFADKKTGASIPVEIYMFDNQQLQSVYKIDRADGKSAAVTTPLALGLIGSMLVFIPVSAGYMVYDTFEDRKVKTRSDYLKKMYMRSVSHLSYNLIRHIYVLASSKDFEERVRGCEESEFYLQENEIESDLRTVGWIEDYIKKNPTFDEVLTDRLEILLKRINIYHLANLDYIKKINATAIPQELSEVIPACVDFVFYGEKSGYMKKINENPALTKKAFIWLQKMIAENPPPNRYVSENFARLFHVFEPKEKINPWSDLDN